MPNAGDSVYVDIAGNQRNTTTNNKNYGGHQFDFPINQDFNYNNYYGGDTFNVAGNSIFNNSTVNNLKAGDLQVSNLFVTNTYNTYNNGGGGDGGGQTGGGGNGPGGGGRFGGIPTPGVPQPASTQVATFLKDVSIYGDVVVPTVLSAKIKDDGIALTPQTTPVQFSTTGTVDVPVAQSGKISALTATGKITFQTVTGGTLSGATASGKITYDTYPTATCGTVSGTVSLPTGGSLSGATASGSISYDTYPTATVGAVTGTVSVPTTGSFSATPTGIAASADVGTLTGQVTFDIPTGGYVDSSCKLVLTTTSVTKTVVFAGAPNVSITSQGKVDGTVALAGDTNRQLNISGPSVTLNKSTATTTPTFTVKGGSVTLSGSTQTPLSITAPTITLTKDTVTITPGFSVNGGTFTPTTTSTSQDVSVTTAAATVTITNNDETKIVTSSGEIDVPGVKSAKITDSTVTLTGSTDTPKLNLKIGKKSDFIIYLRPRA
jgi:hypothetical protein